MRLPIPDDWDGERWTCIEVQWPDSDKWLALLAGFLTTPSRGRFWDERSGTITTVQQIGRDIDNANLPFNPCAGGAPAQPPPELIYKALQGFSECEDDCMACDIPYGALRWHAGRLQYRFCGEWFDVEGTASGADAPYIAPDDDFTPPEIDAGGYSACGKAEAVMDLVWRVLTSIFDEVGNFSWQWWGHIKDDLPGIGLDAKWIISACFGAVDQQAADAAAGPAYDPDAFDASAWQSVKCLLAQQFSATLPEPLGGNEIRSKLQGYFASEWGIDLLTNAVFVDALRGINRESFEQAVLTGASYDEADCDCPSGLGYAGAIYFTGGWSWGSHSGVTMTVEPNTSESGSRIRFAITNDGAQWREAQNIVLGLAGAQIGNDIVIRYRPYQGVELSTEEWEVIEPVYDPALWSIVTGEDIGAGTENYTPGAGYMDYECLDMSAPMSGVRIDARFAPNDTHPAKTYYWDLEIVSIDGNPV